MNCRSAEELIQHSLDAPLTPPQRARLDAHLNECPACRRIWSEYRRLSRAASEWVPRPSPAETPPADFTAQVLSRVAQQSAPMRLPWAVAALVTLTAALLSPLASPWLPVVPHWTWPRVEAGDFWVSAMSASVARWAEILLLPALTANIVLLRRARRAT